LRNPDVAVAKRLGAFGLSVIADDRGMGVGEDRPRDGMTREAQTAAIAAALRLAARIAADSGVRLLLESLNSVLDHRGISSITQRPASRSSTVSITLGCSFSTITIRP
jgi:hypothetical protein